jgi:hypothetical protein
VKIASKPHRSANPSRDAISQIAASVRKGELVAIIGSGVSMGLTKGAYPALSWKGLVVDGFRYAVTKGKITEAQAKAWQPQLDSTDLDDLLGAAEFVSRKLDAPNGDMYARWLEKAFKAVAPTDTKLVKAISRLHALRIPFATLNYDSLLERVTSLPTLNLTDTARVGYWMRRDAQFILHLHGSWDAPASCILGIRDYQTTLGNDVRDLIQHSLGSFKRLLFIGCGDTFADPNFSALSNWLRKKMGTGAPEHYALVTDGEVKARAADPSWQGFVEPIGYGPSHDKLADFLLNNFQGATPASKNSAASRAKTSSAARNDKLIQEYRTFLIKDCGQMTIEGVRADMDTAQRRFDLERLFVPLCALPVPPEISKSDPGREEKLREWHAKNKDPIPFAEVLQSNKQIALLALPGGGKTMLLKRLAVAYADAARLSASSDGLPKLDLIPVLLRCREWKEHIHQPVLTLLKSLPEITGQPQLSGLGNALIPLFKAGRILLLVDGLDEIHDDALRTTFVDHLESFLADNGRSHFVVTSREAGFALVAPALSRFCSRWRVAPLSAESITDLCSHWHRLMLGESPEALQEAANVSEQLVGNESLLRLAENPLLLTMLLVVKHGAGRLPPDKVSLYSRAVEVLLDTWNIKGHEPLNVKEAIPQLAFIAFCLLRDGKQTATEKELIALLEEARDKVPLIGRYAKDDPHSFLKRVELRSSLLVEGGHQAEGAGTVPFYQFRHLTFQEYLAAVAAVEGHYEGYEKSHTVLTPLKDYLEAEEWKEVIPMAAVLARKQAEPLFGALVDIGNAMRRCVESNEGFVGKDEWVGYPPRLPTAIANIVHCLREEAEAAPETLTSALHLTVFFARGCFSNDGWQAFARGPYGEELLHQAWHFYEPMKWPAETWARNTYADLAAYSRPVVYWVGIEGRTELTELLASQKLEELGRGLLTLAGLPWTSPDTEQLEALWVDKLLLNRVEHLLFREEPAIIEAAVWAWTVFQENRRDQSESLATTSRLLDRLLHLWLSRLPEAENVVDFALSTQLGLPRDAWASALSEEQAMAIRESISLRNRRMAAALVIGFHSRKLWSDEELAELLRRPLFGVRESARHRMLSQIETAGKQPPSRNRTVKANQTS